MSDAPGDPEADEKAIEEHEHVDAETAVDDIEQLFTPDNDQIPPPSPDAPPP